MPSSSKSPEENYSPERWQRIEELYHSALKLEGEQRPAFLERECGTDEALRRAVDSLLGYRTVSGDALLNEHAVEVVAQMVAEEAKDNCDDPWIGRTIGSLKFVGKLGSGGMGVVYKAVNLRLHKYVAIKFLPEILAHDPAARERFLREARAAAAVTHPNICTIHDIAEHEGKLFIVMELLEGSTLAEHIQRKPLAPERVIGWAADMACGLAAAHGRGIIHRDIKPANIFITNDGRVKILDFGLAKTEAQTQSLVAAIGEFSTIADVSTPGIAMGTVPYMSPEQARGEELDSRTDIFSFGATLYEMATGTRAFAGKSVAEIHAAILNADPTPARELNLEVSPRLQEIITKALQKDPAKRYQSAVEIRTDLQASKQQERGNDAESPDHGSANAWPMRTKLAFSSAVVLLILAASLAAYFWPRPAIDSLAVLPFANAGNDSNMEYLSDGLTESVIDGLSQIPDLHIMARSTVFRYKGKGLDAQKIGRELGVRAVLSGEVLEHGDTLTIRAELVDSSNGLRLWGGQYSRPAAGIIMLQQDLAKQISDTLRLRLSGKDKVKLARRPTENPEAYQLYLKGRYEFTGLRRIAWKKRLIISNKQFKRTRTTRRPMLDWQTAMAVCPFLAHCLPES